MKSSVLALAVFFLGLSATTAEQDSCKPQCEIVKNDTTSWENGVQLKFDLDVVITVSKIENVLVFQNIKTGIVIAFDFKAQLAIVVRNGATIGIVFDFKNNVCIIVKTNYDVLVGDFAKIRETLIKAQSDISAKTTETFTIVIVGGKVVINASATIKTQIETDYGVLITTIEANVQVNINFIGNFVLVVIGQSSGFGLHIADVISTVTTVGVQINVNFAILIIKAVQTTSIDILSLFKTSFQAAGNKLDEAINNIKSGIAVERTLKFGKIIFNFSLTLVKEYFRLALRLGKIAIDVAYSGKALAVLNNNVNIYNVVYGQYYFIYSVELEAGLLIKGSQSVYVKKADIQGKIGSNTVINSGTLAQFISAYGEAQFSSGTKIALKDFKDALKSQSQFEVFCGLHGIANANVAYKVFANYAAAITGILVYGLDVTVAIKVTFSLNFSYEIDQDCYSNPVVAGVAGALAVTSSSVISVVSPSAVFNSVKIIIERA